MIKSMTGFGRCETEEHARRITVEMKAVNHRYLDLSIKMPKKFNPFEAQIRNVLKEYIERGKVDLYITCEDLGEENLQIRYNKAVAAEYLQYLRQMSEEFGLEDDIRVSTLSRFPEVFSMEDVQQDEEEIWQDLEKTVRGAAAVFVESREREGEALKADLLDKLESMQTSVAQIEERSPQVIEEYREKLRAKVRELVGDVQLDESRLMMEVTVFADKICVDEEMVRLKSHIAAMSQELKKGGSVGRKLDFIAQEMNREANTTLSKANDLLTSDAAIELKTGIEKIREQIQNLE
ncbi:MAG: YicC family protein [Lachnospiraceae bacterium]|nr:YicC family protein [Lachnospiraceae bacterium]MBR6158244.1 YicC family protein [Lachnospiraceae bacterium]MBR6851995.1 YicC family protein [Lachnospiraceae bacterium]